MRCVLPLHSLSCPPRQIYARNSPNSCVLDVENQMAVSFRMGYQDLNCDVHQDSPGVFTSDIIIQV